jgi:hypothetical protein
VMKAGCRGRASSCLKEGTRAARGKMNFSGK